jgi:hypothetical protein
MEIINLYQSKLQRELQRELQSKLCLCKMATTFPKVTRNRKISKYELYKIIYNESNIYIEWLDEIKKNGVDSKMRVRNPLHKGTFIHTDKNGLYSTLWNLCVVILQGSYDFHGIPYPTKIVYKHPAKFYRKP